MSDFVQSSGIHDESHIRKSASQNRRLRRIMLPFLLLSAVVVAIPQSTVTLDQTSAIRGANKPLPTPEKLTPSAIGEPSLQSALIVGDKLKIELFQKNATGEAQSASGNAPKGAAGWGLRQEVSGIFTVQEDGTIVLPILGSFAAVNRSIGDVSADIVASYRANFATDSRVAVTIAERPPIYVVGGVKTPGSFRYEAGLTALHAIALSGGVERGPSDQWSTIELAREGAKAASAAQILKIAAAELAVLRAERDGTAPVTPKDLVALLGQDAARLAVTQSHERRKTRLDAFDKQRTTLQLGLEVAKKNMVVDAERMAVLTKGASARTQRVDVLQGFVTKGMSSQALLNQAQAEMSDNDDRALTAKSHLGDSEYKVSLASQDLNKFDLDRLLERDAAIASLEKEVVESQANLKVFDSIKEQLSARMDLGDRSGAQIIEIVRKHPRAAVLSPADPTATLNPGDLVRIQDPRPSRNN